MAQALWWPVRKLSCLLSQLARRYNQFGGIDESALDRLSLARPVPPSIAQTRPLQLLQPVPCSSSKRSLLKHPHRHATPLTPPDQPCARIGPRRVSQVTEMTKLIHVKAGGGSVDEIGHFSPSFLWLLRDFYLELRRGRKRRRGAIREYLSGP